MWWGIPFVKNSLWCTDGILYSEWIQSYKCLIFSISSSIDIIYYILEVATVERFNAWMINIKKWLAIELHWNTRTFYEHLFIISWYLFFFNEILTFYDQINYFSNITLLYRNKCRPITFTTLSIYPKPIFAILNLLSEINNLLEIWNYIGIN